MQPMKQSTYESCLSCCLLMLCGQSQKDEINVWKHGWEFNYLIGQLNFVTEKFDQRIENEFYFNQLEKQKNNRVEFVNKKIDIVLIRELLESGPVIVYLDCYYLQKILHAPHFVLAVKCDENTVTIIDPRDGLQKTMPVNILEDSITSLRSHLLYSPVLVSKI